MDNSKVKLDFPQMRGPDFITLAMRVSLMLYASLFFVLPPIVKIAFDAAILDFQTKYVAALGGKDPVKNDARNSAYIVLLRMMRQMAYYVDSICMGDRIKLLLSGFNILTPNSRTGKAIFTVVNGEFSGDVVASWGSDDSAYSYVLRYSINEDGLTEIYTQVETGTCGITIHGLIKGKEYMFSLASIYTGQRGVYCDPIYLVIL